MTTPLFLLRCVQLGLSIRDLDLLTIGMVNDMYIESRNDEYKYAVVATHKDFDLFSPARSNPGFSYVQFQEVSDTWQAGSRESR